MLAIMAAHGAPYVAQVSPSKWKDMVAKIQKGFAAEGPYLSMLSLHVPPSGNLHRKTR